MLHFTDRNKGNHRAVKHMPSQKKLPEKPKTRSGIWSECSSKHLEVQQGQRWWNIVCTDRRQSLGKSQHLVVFFLLWLAIPFVGGKSFQALFFQIVLYFHPYQQLPDPGLPARCFPTDSIMVTSSADSNAIKQPMISFLNSGEYNVYIINQ